MSTLSGLGSKGEKQKSKYQSLDINRIYRGSRGESSEKTQQKSTIPYKHGMQILGKVPNARRPPANLPSLKSEHSGSEAAVPLVPPGGPGWGKQENSTPNGLPAGKTDSQQIPPSVSHQGTSPSQIISTKQELPHVPSAPVDKSWSSVMNRSDSHSHHPPPYQGPQFQHDFPSLSATEGGQVRNGGPDAPYSSGLSLRPQTEGSWILGGSGSGGEGKPASGHLGAPPQLSAQAGLAQQQQQTLPPQYRGVMPPFMYKNSPPPTNVPPNQAQNHLTAVENSNVQEKPIYNNKKSYEDVPPSIIKEEDLHRMDEIERDMGWAYSDDIDYNKKLSFSDDEILSDKTLKPKHNYDNRNYERSSEPKKETNDAWQNSSKGHSSEEEDIKIKRNQHSKEVEMAVQRAKQRKKEEEKRFNEATKQGAKQKLKELEEKISKRDRDYEETVGTINPSVIPPKPIAPTEIPLPDFQKEKDVGNFKERDERPRMSSEGHDDKIEKMSTTFKQLTEIEGKTSFRRNTKNQERETREQGVPTFSRQFQSNLPPRFKRQHNQQNVQPQFGDHFDNRSPIPQNYSKGNPIKKLILNNPVTDHEVKKGSLDDSSTLSHVPSEIIRKSDSPYIHDNYEFDSTKHTREDKFHEEKMDRKEFDKKEYDRRDFNQPKSRSENVPADNKTKNNRSHDNIFERFQRLDSQESKLSRDSKYSSDVDSREYTSWAEPKFDLSFDERRREGPREDRRQVPGPITRDRIEADDINESRNLTALKRGQMPEKKIAESKAKDEKNNDNLEVKGSEVLTDSKVWSDYSDKSKNNIKSHDKDNKLIDSSKKFVKHDEYRDDKRGSSNRNKIYPQNKVWNNEYHHRPGGERGGWPKRSNSTNKNIRSTGQNKDSFVGITTDSEGSSEEHHSKDDQSHKNVRSDRDRPMKHHLAKDDKRNSRPDKDRMNEKSYDGKRDNYVPRGEPSRHGRGGGNFRGRVGLSKRIDGYGPPPSKSPFTHHDKKSNEYDGDSFQNIGNIMGNEKDTHVDLKNDEKALIMEDKFLDDKDMRNRMTKNSTGSKSSSGSLTTSRKPNQQTRSINEKKPYGVKVDSSSSLQPKLPKSDESNLLCNAIADISLKSKEELGEELEEEGSIHGDSDGFQEVKSKKAVKERPKIEDKVSAAFPGKIVKLENKEREKMKKPPPPIQQPTHNIPPLMATLVNPPHLLPQPSKNQFDRQYRQNKIPPRFAKLRENSKLQKIQQHGMVDMSDMKCRSMFNPKMSHPPGTSPVVPMSNAWDKPLAAQLRPTDADNILVPNLDAGNNIEHSPAPGEADADKKTIKTAALSDAAILDGATPPVNTIIFENTNFKSVPSSRNVRNDKIRKEDGTLENQSMSSFNKPINDLLNKNDKQDSIQLQLQFKEDGGDMKLDFFDSDLSLTDEKALKNPCLTRSMHSMSAGGNNISTADALNFKIQSVKKVWETPSEHSVTQEDVNSSFSSSFAPDPNSLDSSSFVKGNDSVEDNHEQHGYNPAVNQQTSNNTTNVCKVKPTQQVSGASSQTVSSTSGGHPTHSGMMGPGLMGNPLSPPPIQPVIGAGVGIGQPPQQYPTNQHIGYQTGLGSSSQFGMSTIPSPPSVLPYTAQPLQAQTANLYGPFQIDQTGVLGGQGRSQFSQYPNHYGLGQAASSPYSAQSMFLQTQAHPPPTAQGPEIYQNINNYRLSTGPFGQNQQLNNPTTVLISSTSNSLMSASVKPSTQQISAIGTKSGGVGQAYQQQSQQGQQMYMFDPNIQANYLQGAGVLQRPAGPVQNNVVPAIQPSSSYYSGSTGTAKPFNCSWRF